jgi:hypothetical protein
MEEVGGKRHPYRKTSGDGGGGWQGLVVETRVTLTRFF